MRLHLRLAKVKPDQIEPATRGVDRACQSHKFRLHQAVSKAVRDTVSHQVQAHRYQGLKCKRTFRVYPTGVSAAQTSLRVKGLAVMLYLLGLSDGATSLALEARGVSRCKSRVDEAVQEAASRVPDLKREQVLPGLRTPALEAELTTVKCKGQWLPLGVTVAAIRGLVLTVDSLATQEVEALKQWIEPIAKTVGAEVLVPDDAR